jgi:hypothetical protein
MQEQPVTKQPSREQPGKKPYHRPHLTMYGPLRGLTQNNPTGKRNDGGKGLGQTRS